MAFQNQIDMYAMVVSKKQNDVIQYIYLILDSFDVLFQDRVLKTLILFYDCINFESWLKLVIFKFNINN